MLGTARGFMGGGLRVGLRGFRFGLSMDLGGKGGGVTLSRQVVGTMGTVLLCTCLRLLFVSSEFWRTSGGVFSWLVLFLACRRFLKLCPVRLDSDLGRPLRKPVFGNGDGDFSIGLRGPRRGVEGAASIGYILLVSVKRV